MVENRCDLPVGLSLLFWPLAAVAFAGAASLITDVVDLGPPVTGRLPFHSPAVAGIVLAIVVGLPMTVAAVRSRRGARNAAPAAFVAGTNLTAWVLAQQVVIRDFGAMQAVLLLAGVLITVTAYRAFPGPRRTLER